MVTVAWKLVKVDRTNPWRWSVRASGVKNLLKFFRVIWGLESLLAITSSHSFSHSQLIIYAIAYYDYCPLQLFHELSRNLDLRMLVPEKSRNNQQTSTRLDPWMPLSKVPDKSRMTTSQTRTLLDETSDGITGTSDQNTTYSHCNGNGYNLLKKSVEMSQNFNGYSGTPHCSPPPHANNDFTGLMGSLISPGPGPATPLQQAFGVPFYHAAAWQNGGQGNYNFSVPFQGAPVNEDAWNQNGGEEYMTLGQEEDEDEDEGSLMVVDDTEILKNLQNKQQLNQNSGVSNRVQAANHETSVKLGQLPNLASSSPLALPHPRLQGPTIPAPALGTKSPMVNDSAARAAELRAKLLAKRPSTTASPRASPAVNKAELPNATKTNAQELQKQTNGARTAKVKTEDASKILAVQATAATKADEKSTSKPQEQPQGKPVKDDEFEHLFAQARNAADSAKPNAKMTNGSRLGRASAEKPVDLPTNNLKQTKLAVSDNRPALQKNHSSSEMSEGEIHSGPSSPIPILAPPSPKATETKESKQADQDKNEKIMRQNEVNKAYQPLRTSKQPATEPAKTGPKMPDRSKAEPLPSPKLSNKQLKQQAWKQKNGYAGSHDLYPDSRRDREWDRARDLNGRDDERDSKKPSASQAFANSAQVERAARRRLSDDEIRRQQRTEDNARRAAEYKKNLDAQRTAASKKTLDSSKVISSPKDDRRQEAEPRASQPTRPNERDGSTAIQLRIDTQMPTVDLATAEQDINTVMLSPTGQNLEGNEDINDWLELTEYHDLAHREKRLTWFRKKRALDVQRAEVEREEQLELQERSMLKRSQSVLPPNASPNTTRRASIVHAKMPPPALPLKEANNVGIKIKDSALSAGLPTSQTPTATLKRQHAEDDVDTRRMQPADKIARIDINGHAANEKPLTSPASVKGEGSAVRGDRYIPRQGRSRSPGFKRRSLSPRRQRRSRSPSPYGNRTFSSGNGFPRHLRTCHNCGQPGHIVNECTEPRRDGKEWNRTSEYQQWVSPNYRGRNPVAVARGGGNRSPHPRAGGNGNRSRYSSVGKTEDGEPGSGRENIGGASLRLEDGGQYRR